MYKYKLFKVDEDSNFDSIKSTHNRIYSVEINVLLHADTYSGVYTSSIIHSPKETVYYRTVLYDDTYESIEAIGESEYVNSMNISKSKLRFTEFDINRNHSILILDDGTVLYKIKNAYNYKPLLDNITDVSNDLKYKLPYIASKGINNG